MKKLLAIVAVLVGCVVAEAPYPPSGFRPSGPAFELPQKTPQKQQEYLPPVDPRRPSPPTEYGTPEEEDVSVQGLPTQEQLPIFQISPINGQLYHGPQFNTDLRNLDSSDSFRFNQYQLQQQKYRELERQRELEAAQARSRANQFPSQQVPRQFAQSTPRTTESTFSTKNYDEEPESTTPALDLNEGETLDDSKKDDNKQKVTVEVSKQNIQEYPGELFLSSLAQLQLQPQFVPIQQFGQLNAPLQYNAVQEARGYDAQTHFAALPSVLAQRQQLQPQYQQGFVNPALLVATQDPIQVQQANQYQPLNQYAPQQDVSVSAFQVQPASQYQPLNQYAPQTQMYPQPIVVQQSQFSQQQQPQFVQPQQPQFVQPQQPQFVQPQQPQNDENRQDQDQFLYQQTYQPQQVVYQQQYPQNPEQQNYILPQAQLINYPQLVQQYQNQNERQIFQGQDSLQSGIDLDQGNDVEEPKKDDENENDGSKATAVATAFGARTQPRVMTRYGAPFPREQLQPFTTTESTVQDEQVTENSGAVAEANAFATGQQRKSAKQRVRKVRPIFTLDRSGHLVLANEQN